MKEREISRTSRVLAAFHLFLNCEEVSYRELEELTGAARKTAYRDIRLLERAGVVRCRYSRRAGAFVPLGEAFVPEPFEPPVCPENRSAALYLDKLVRLCTMMTEMWGEPDPIDWYRRRYPALSSRTRQRDLRELWRVSYEVWYVPKDEWSGEAGSYEYRYPSGAYDIYFNS